ncbi:uncharacterized protein LOC133316810 [Gastrolobium bilobum]|uniref:uncharacterized protein LOC133316810 n=1 Tax=Gastrolobium bilobum TaxID=150636 RepID=UPI002AAF4FC5|nr:uncharacterized protein LOC133316810 [Gastrolobium bilobum]XP_061374577.1 uncharacterized protein LOC133316810 [Gastrolobium bilobum]
MAMVLHVLYISSFPNSSPLTSFKASNISVSPPHSKSLILNATPLSLRGTKHYLFSRHRSRTTRTRATLDDIERDNLSSTPLLVEDENPKKEVEESVKVLKNAAKTRKVAAEEVLSALSVIEKAKIDPSGFLETLGGKESPGRTWMLIFTAKKQLKGGRYFPLTAVQRFDAAAKRIENGVYLGPIGQLTFEGRLSWKKRILAFTFENLRIRVGPLKPLQISLGNKEDMEPGTKDPFFIWFYVDEEIAVARGRSGGTAFWCRCQRVNV